ncbi:hypothetical protein FKM82_002546 [Ascaphus truei]
MHEVWKSSPISAGKKMTCKCPQMSDAAHDMDTAQEFADENTRMRSFANFPGSCPVSAPALARAGFYYTGDGDRVKCYSCQGVVQGWQYGETAIGKHRKISPNCTFISAFNLRSDCIQTQIPILQNSNPHLVANCSGNSAHTHDSEINADYLLRTGRVVDMSETRYPRNITMLTEEARLRTFQNWPSYARLTPKELASAGLYYTGSGDQVTCFCCGGKLVNWEPGDQAWTEHKRHFPDCFFVLGRDVGNVAFESNSASVGRRRGSEVYPAMNQYKSRLESFAQWKYPSNKETLAKAGFYSTGEGDATKCFYCGGSLKDWKLKEDPWKQHATWFPGCKFLLEEKGQHFVNNVQLNRPLQNNAAVSAESCPALPEDNDLKKNALVNGAEQMGFHLGEIKNIMGKKLKSTGANYTSLDLLVSDLLNAQAAQVENGEEKPKENESSVEEQLRQLQEEKICKVCMDNVVSIVFIPCGHLVACTECAEAMNKCPICNAIILRRQKTFMS